MFPDWHSIFFLKNLIFTFRLNKIYRNTRKNIKAYLCSLTTTILNCSSEKCSSEILHCNIILYWILNYLTWNLDRLTIILFWRNCWNMRRANRSHVFLEPHGNRQFIFRLSFMSLALSFVWNHFWWSTPENLYSFQRLCKYSG